MRFIEPLDGYEFPKKCLKWAVFPGRLILWMLYMFPSGGFIGVASSARQARSPVMVVAYSIGFYLAIIGVIAVSLLS